MPAVAVTAYQDEGLSLEPCSAPGTTVWIIDTVDDILGQCLPDHQRIGHRLVQPFTMSILGNPAHQLFTPIILQHLTGSPGSEPANQLWGDHFGPVS